MYRVHKHFVMTEREATMLVGLLERASNQTKDHHLMIFASRYAAKIKKALTDKPQKI